MTTRQTEYTGSSESRSGSLLRTVLKLDAVTSGAVGVLLLAASSVLDGILGTPVALHVPVGVFFVVYAMAVFFVATRSEISAPAARTVIVSNAAWAVVSLLIVIAGLFPLTSLGVVFALFQGAVVALFAVVQGYALRRRA